MQTLLEVQRVNHVQLERLQVTLVKKIAWNAHRGIMQIMWAQCTARLVKRAGIPTSQVLSHAVHAVLVHLQLEVVIQSAQVVLLVSVISFPFSDHSYNNHRILSAK